MNHYFSKNQDSVLRTKTIELNIRGINETITLSSGTFSAKKLDKGTQILAENMIIKENDTVLDLGCGVGIVGLIASYLTKNIVILTDINKRATFIAKKNTQHRKNIKVLHGNMFEPVKDKKFNVILFNPPQAAGKEICNEMIKQSKEHLLFKGTLQVIARHNKGGRSFEKIMQEIFGNVSYLTKTSGYRVYCSVKKN